MLPFGRGEGKRSFSVGFGKIYYKFGKNKKLTSKTDFSKPPFIPPSKGDEIFINKKYFVLLGEK